MMKKFILEHKEFLIGLGLTLSLLWPLFASGYFSHHDNVQVIRLYEMDKCFKDFQIPCRWVPDLGMLYGYPMFNFYAPLAYYYGEVVYKILGGVIENGFIVSAKVMFATSFVFSYIFMFLLGRKLWGEKGGALSAIFFSFAPYHAVLIFVRGAMGELWGVMFYPAIFWALLKLREKISILNLLLLAVFSAGLILSHNLSSMIFFPILLGFTIVLLITKKQELQILKGRFLIFFAAALILAAGLSSFYWIPLMTEKNLVHVETTTSGYFSYTEHFKGLKKLFLDPYWGWGASVREVPGGEKDGISYQIGWVHLLGWALSLYAFIKLRKDRPTLAKTIIFSSFIIWLSIFMINPRSEPLWKLIDPLKYLQFPWRLLGLIIFFISLASGSILTVINKKYINFLWVGLVLLVVALNFFYFRPEKFFNINDKYFFTAEEWDRQLKRSVFDFLPIYAKEPPALLAPARYEILTGETQVLDIQEGTNWFNFKTDTKSHTIIRLSQYYFPNWQIKVDGKIVKIDYENNLGLMTIILGQGHHFVEGRLYDTQQRIIGNKLTVISAVLFVLLGLSQIQKVRRWLLYYLRRIN